MLSQDSRLERCRFAVVTTADISIKLIRNTWNRKVEELYMTVQGTLKWASSERYDGEWEAGEESGVGIYSWPDGSTYNGFWIHGKKNGALPL